MNFGSTFCDVYKVFLGARTARNECAPTFLSVATPQKSDVLINMALYIWLVTCNVQILQEIRRDHSDTAVENPIDQSLFRKQPLVFSSMIILNWCEFLVELLAWKPVGMTMLPAFGAMISPESLRFLIYQLMFLLMATHA